SYGFTTRLREMYDQTFPEIADKVERSRTKLVLLTAGCPETCHRSIANLAREIEARGVPTLIISASPAATESVRPPRAMTFAGSALAESGQHLSADDFFAIEKDTSENAGVYKRLREFKLQNSDEPDFTFSSSTKRW